MPSRYATTQRTTLLSNPSAFLLVCATHDAVLANYAVQILAVNADATPNASVEGLQGRRTSGAFAN